MLPLLAGVAAFLYSRNQPLVYKASATLLVQQSRGSTPGVSDFALSEQLANTYRRLVQRPLVWARSLFSRQETGTED